MSDDELDGQNPPLSKGSVTRPTTTTPVAAAFHCVSRGGTQTDSQSLTGPPTPSVFDGGSWVNALFARYHNTLMKFLRQRLFNQDEAEDLAQEVYYRMVRLKDPDNLRYPGAFLIQTANNLLKDSNRYRQRHHADTHIEFDEQSTQVEGAEPGHASPETALITEEELQSVMASLSELSSKYQVVFLMHRIEGQSYKTIANELNISVSRVEKYVIRTLKHLRKKFVVTANGQRNQV